MSGADRWLVVQDGDTERFIDRAQIVQITFHTQPAHMHAVRGGEYEALAEEERANPDIPAQLIAEILTTLGGDPVHLTDEAAWQLRAQIAANSLPDSHALHALRDTLGQLFDTFSVAAHLRDRRAADHALREAMRKARPAIAGVIAALDQLQAARDAPTLTADEE